MPRSGSSAVRVCEMVAFLPCRRTPTRAGSRARGAPDTPGANYPVLRQMFRYEPSERAPRAGCSLAASPDGPQSLPARVSSTVTAARHPPDPSAGALPTGRNPLGAGRTSFASHPTSCRPPLCPRRLVLPLHIPKVSRWKPDRSARNTAGTLYWVGCLQPGRLLDALALPTGPDGPPRIGGVGLVDSAVGIGENRRHSAGLHANQRHPRRLTPSL